MNIRAETGIAGAVGVALGVSCFLAFGGQATGSLPYLGTAAAMGAIAAFVLVASGWIDPLTMVIVSLPLPALYETEEARLAPVLVVSAMAVAGWAANRGMDRRPLVARPDDARPFVLLLSALCVAAVFAADPVGAAREIVNFVLLLGLLLLTLDRVSARPEGAARLVRWVAGVAAVAGALAVPEALGLLPSRFALRGTGLNRAAGGFGWPNELAMFLAISLPLCVYVARDARTRLGRAWSYGAVALTALGLVSTFSRGSWLSLAVAPGVLFLVRGRGVALRFWLLAFVGAVAFNLAWGGAIVTRVAATSEDVLVVQRALLTVAGLLMFRAHPIVGVGPGGFGDSLEQVGLQLPSLFDFTGSAQNGYVQMAAEAGVVGLVALLFFVGYTLSRLLKGARATCGTTGGRGLRLALLWSFATACIVSLFEWPFGHGIGELIVVVAGTGLALSRHVAPDA